VNPLSRRAQLVFGITATLILSGLSLVAIGSRGNPFSLGFPTSYSCMMGQSNGMIFGGAMRLSTDRATVTSGTTSFLVTNVGSVSHEMLILPLPNSQIVGTLPIGGDGRVDEVGSLGEASNTCGEGAGQGIAPGATSWVTVDLAPGRYELICNLPGHYAAGMYTQLTVS
jgi:uncharacterized cupredoxin-like copper-binding protein